MPLDDRLNNALRDNANTFEPDLDAAWDQIQRSRHRTTIRRTIALATVAAAVPPAR